MIRYPKLLLHWLFTVYVYTATYILMILGSIVTCPLKILTNHHWAHKLGFRWALGACIPLAFVRTIVTRHPDADPEQRGVFLQNHVSVLDGSLATWTIPHEFCGLFNDWHFWIPGYGWIMGLSKGIGVPTGEDAKGRIQAINEQAKQRAASNMSILAFPEGHRTRDGKVGPFRRGAFFMAREAGLPVIPLCVRGMWEVESKRGWLFTPGTVEVYFGKPVDTVGLSDEAIGELTEKLREVHVGWVEHGQMIDQIEEKAA